MTFRKSLPCLLLVNTLQKGSKVEGISYLLLLTSLLSPGDSYDDRSGERPEEARSRQRSPHSGHRRGGARGRRQRGDLQPHLLRERPQSVHGELRGPDPGCGLPRYTHQYHSQEQIETSDEMKTDESWYSSLYLHQGC